jgi:hypothetical protein
MLGGLDQFWPPIVPCYSTEDAVRIGTSFISIPITRNYIHSQLFLTLCHIYTAYNHTHSWLQSLIPLLHWLTSQLSITVSNYHKLYIFTLRSSRQELTVQIHFLRLLLTNCLHHSHSGNWIKPANSFAYIAELFYWYPNNGCTGRSTVLLRHVPHSRNSLTRWRLVSWQPRKHTWHSLTPEVWCHHACTESCLPVGCLATHCCATQQWVDMS